ncbi:hypothetical protein TNCV_923671 [Trichonephila clavipes]|nr:hypothetical protein TNCV_923671 [Trichonephila clavipes]
MPVVGRSLAHHSGDSTILLGSITILRENTLELHDSNFLKEDERKAVQLWDERNVSIGSERLAPAATLCWALSPGPKHRKPAFPSSHKTFSLLPEGAPKGDTSGHLQHVHTANSHNSFQAQKRKEKKHHKRKEERKRASEEKKGERKKKKFLTWTL